MSAISGSGIQPSEIFRIIGMSREYKYLRKEIRKILNQINLYGYDLVTALTNVSKTTPSQKLSELYSGLGTTIHSGGNLKEFFEKRAESLLLAYKIDREKYAKTAESFMDIYISVVIAAPMILMLLLIIMTIANFNIGFTTTQFTLLIIAALAFINIIFLTILHISQPTY
jgi:archaeal flagellar protein FlaJ